MKNKPDPTDSSLNENGMAAGIEIKELGDPVHQKKITDAVGALHGVVETKIEKGALHVSYDPLATTEKKIKQAVCSTGTSASRLRPQIRKERIQIYHLQMSKAISRPKCGPRRVVLTPPDHARATYTEGGLTFGVHLFFSRSIGDFRTAIYAVCDFLNDDQRMGEPGASDVKESNELALVSHLATRRKFIRQVAGTSAALAIGPHLVGSALGDHVTSTTRPAATSDLLKVHLKINGKSHALDVDPRVTLLDACGKICT